MKYSVPRTEAECRLLMGGNLEWMKTRERELVKELYAKMQYQRLRPHVLVSYIRKAFIYVPGNVRITFDSG